VWTTTSAIEQDVQPLVSIVIPTKDRPTHLVRAVRCALDQADVEVEVVVVDDGSRRPAEAVLRHELDRAPDRLRVVRSASSSGVARARNRGAALACGHWLGFCDDDDMWAPTKLSAHLAGAGRSAAWSCSGAVKVDERFHAFEIHHPPRPGELLRQLLARNVIPGGASSVVIRTELFELVGGFDPSFSTLADWDLWIRLAEQAPIAVVDDPLVAYLVQPASMSTDTARFAEEVSRLLAKHRGPIDQLAVEFDSAGWHRYLGEMDLRANRRLAAGAHYLAASRRGLRGSWKVAALAAISPRLARRWLHRRTRVRHEHTVTAAQAWVDRAVAAGARDE